MRFLQNPFFKPYNRSTVVRPVPTGAVNACTRRRPFLLSSPILKVKKMTFISIIPIFRKRNPPIHIPHQVLLQRSLQPQGGNNKVLIQNAKYGIWGNLITLLLSPKLGTNSSSNWSKMCSRESCHARIETESSWQHWHCSVSVVTWHNNT